MAWLAVDRDGTEVMFDKQPVRSESVFEEWVNSVENFGKRFMSLPSGSIAKLIGRPLTWDDEPVELKDQ